MGRHKKIRCTWNPSEAGGFDDSTMDSYSSDGSNSTDRRVSRSRDDSYRPTQYHRIVSDRATGSSQGVITDQDYEHHSWRRQSGGALAVVAPNRATSSVFSDRPVTRAPTLPIWLPPTTLDHPNELLAWLDRLWSVPSGVPSVSGNVSPFLNV